MQVRWKTDGFEPSFVGTMYEKNVWKNGKTYKKLHVLMFGLKILKTMVDWCLVTTKEKRNNSEQFFSFKVHKKYAIANQNADAAECGRYVGERNVEIKFPTYGQMQHQVWEESETKKRVERRSKRAKKQQNLQTLCFSIVLERRAVGKYAEGGGRGAILSDKRSKIARGCGAITFEKIPQRPHTFGLGIAQKVHAAVTRSTFPMQNVKNISFLRHFWKLRRSNSARGCGASTFSPQNAIRPSSVIFRARRNGACTLQKVSQTWDIWSLYYGFWKLAVCSLERDAKPQGVPQMTSVKHATKREDHLHLFKSCGFYGRNRPSSFFHDKTWCTGIFSEVELITHWRQQEVASRSFFPWIIFKFLCLRVTQKFISYQALTKLANGQRSSEILAVTTALWRCAGNIKTYSDCAHEVTTVKVLQRCGFPNGWTINLDNRDLWHLLDSMANKHGQPFTMCKVKKCKHDLCQDLWLTESNSCTGKLAKDTAWVFLETRQPTACKELALAMSLQAHLFHRLATRSSSFKMLPVEIPVEQDFFPRYKVLISSCVLLDPPKPDVFRKALFVLGHVAHLQSLPVTPKTCSFLAIYFSCEPKPRHVNCPPCVLHGANWSVWFSNWFE